MDHTNYRVGQDASPPMKAYRKQEEELESRYAFLVSCIVLMALIGLIMHACVDAAVRTVENDEQEARKRIFASETYQRPAAYRLASPTYEQMEARHHVIKLQEVRR